MGTGASKHIADSPVKYQEPDENIKLSIPKIVVTDSPETAERKKRLTEQVKLLESLDSYGNMEAYTVIEGINALYKTANDDKGRRPLGDHLADIGFASLFTKMWKDLMKVNIFDAAANKYAVNVYFKLKGTVHNFSDVSYQLCEEMGKSGAVGLLLSELTLPELNYKKIDQEEGSATRRRCIKSTLGILHNAIRMCADNRPIFRTANAVPLLMEYLKCTYLIVRAKALLNLAYIVDEDENDKITTGGTNISFIVKMLESAVSSEDHMSKTYYFDAEELVDGINKLAQNDQNKVTLVECDVLPLLVEMMKKALSVEEVMQAARCIWTLAFHDKNKSRIREHPELMKELKRHMHCHDKDNADSAHKAARGALWILGEEDLVKELEDSEQSGNGHVDQSKQKSVGHVMISYQWDAQNLVIKIKDRLKAAGYKVWMDIENMEGSTLEAMASAVENASVVLICFSQKYKDSPSCRTEAEYTYRLQKAFIPLKVQAAYQPDGWLGILIGTKLYFDFSVSNKLQQEVSKLTRELGKRGLTSTIQAGQEVDGALKSPIVGKGPTTEGITVTGLATWTNNDVANWLSTIGLGHIKNKFTEYNGEMILGLRLVASESPDFFYSSLKSELGFKRLVDIIKFRTALEKLS